MSADVASSSVADITSSAPRRKSGRVPTQRQLYSPTGSVKRKRGDANDSDVGSGSDAPSSEEEDSESSPDEEELKERRKQSRKKKSTTSAKKPPQKKPKTNGEITGLAIRPAAGARKKAPRPRKAALRKSAIVEQDADGLYGKLRGHINALTQALTSWQLTYSHAERALTTSLPNGSLVSTNTKRKL